MKELSSQDVKEFKRVNLTFKPLNWFCHRQRPGGISRYPQGTRCLVLSNLLFSVAKSVDPSQADFSLRPLLFNTSLPSTYLQGAKTALHCTGLDSTILHCTALHCTVLHATILNCTACIVHYCFTKHYIALHCSVVFFITILHYTAI